MADHPSDLSVAIGIVMGQVLARAPLAPDEDFFDCGGDSLRALDVVNRLLAEQGPVQRYLPAQDHDQDQVVSVLLEAFFDNATPTALDEVLRCSAT